MFILYLTDHQFISDKKLVYFDIVVRTSLGNYSQSNKIMNPVAPALQGGKSLTTEPIPENFILLCSSLHCTKPFP